MSRSEDTEKTLTATSDLGVESKIDARSNSAAPSGRLAALVACVSALVYVGTVRFEFVYDDVTQIVGNRYLQSWSYLISYFQTDVWRAIYGPHLITNYYRPVFVVWMRTNYFLFGLHPFGWHLDAILIHAAVSVLVFYVAFKFTRSQLASVVAAIIFGVHPVHIEAVAWVSGATESLYCLLLLGALLAYMNFRPMPEPDGTLKSGRKAWLVVSVVLFTFALFSKETAIVLPVLIAAYEGIYRLPRYLKNGTRKGMALFECGWPLAIYVLPVVLYTVSRVNAIHGFGRPVSHIGLTTSILTAPSIVFFYLKSLVWPVNRSLFYDLPYVQSATFSDFWLPLSVLLVALALFAALYKRVISGDDKKVVAFFFIWMILPILPVLDLAVLPKGEIVHDRYLYLPSIGFCIIAGILIRMAGKGSDVFLGLNRAQAVIVLPIVLLFAISTAMQSSPWASSLLVYANSVKVAPNSAVAKNALGTEFTNLGHYPQAIPMLEDAQHLDPSHYSVMVNLANVYSRVGRAEDSRRNLLLAISTDPTRPEAYYNLGVLEFSRGRYNEAEAALNQALRIQPEGLRYHYMLAGVYKMEGRLDEALAELKLELQVNPDDPEVLKQYNEIKGKAGK